MKKSFYVVMILAVVFGLSFLSVGFAEGDAAKAPAADAKPAVQAPAADASAKVEAPKADDEMAADKDEMEEESEDVKILREAAAKLKATDPALSAKLEQLAEDFSW